MKWGNFIVGMVVLLLMLPGVPKAASFLEDEAGISASTHVTNVDLNLAATAFKNIEQQTAEYIIGSVALADYDETNDVHVYLDASGDMIAYYLNQEPASKIIDWRHDPTGNLTGSKLEDAMTTICDAMFVALGEVKYYDFRYPSATNIKIIVDEALAQETETFRFLIPSDHILHNATWSNLVHRDDNYQSGTPRFDLDGVTLHSGGGPLGWNYWEGELNFNQLTQDIYHEVTVHNSDGGSYDCFGAIVLLYSVAQ